MTKYILLYIIKTGKQDMTQMHRLKIQTVTNELQILSDTTQQLQQNV